jgi:uncharacterized integral membrane protein
MKYKLIFSSILAGLFTIFIFQNIETADIRFLFWTFPVSRALMLFIIILIGIVIGWFLNSYRQHKKATE